MRRAGATKVECRRRRGRRYARHRSAAMTVPADVLQFLGAQAPFSALPDAALAECAGELEAIYRRRGEVVLDLGVANDSLPIIRKGAVEVSDAQGRLVLRLAEGDSFAFNALLTGEPTRFRYTLLEDALIWRLPAARFHALRREFPAFDRFFLKTLEERLLAAARAPQGNALFATALAAIASRPPRMLPATASIREAAQAMAAGRISSLLVGTPDDLQGIVTDRDLRNRVLAAGLAPERPIADIMTPDPVALDGDADAFAALLVMLDRRIHHLPVRADGRVLGVVTSRDLLALQTEHPLYLIRELGLAADIPALQAILARLPELSARLLSAGADGAGLPKVLTALNDAVTRRLLELARERMGPPPAAFAWLSFGSQARAEQTLYTDQDNGLVVADGADPNDPWFVELARFVCAGLDACGQRFCDGGIMASTPSWRLDLSGWRRQFRAWVAQPQPEALLRASIFFDLRPVAGDAALGRALLDTLAAIGPQDALFLGILARQSLQHEVPLGVFRRFVVERDGAHRDRLDLKRAGLLPLTEMVRVRALGAGLAATAGTRKRLAALAAAGRLAAGDADALGHAFDLFTRLRLVHQLRQLRAGEAADNWIDPDALPGPDRAALRDAFALVRNAQAGLAAEFGVAAP
jgi:CBS domain-containing protein